MNIPNALLAAAILAAAAPAATAQQTINKNAKVAPDATVEVTNVQGTIETGLAPDGEPRLFFTASRRVTFAPRGRPARDTVPVVGTSSKTTMAMPGPDDVVAFEMPPLQVPGGETLPNKLSIRVKLSQTTAQQPRTENR